jgi:CRISP-associated protein Cas1
VIAVKELLVVLDRRESTVRLDGRALRVEHADGWERIPLGLVGLVVVHGSPSVSCDVWRALAERGVPAVMLPSRGTGAAAWAGAGLSTSIQVRRRQHRAASDPAQRLAVAREIVLAKLSAQRAVAQGLGSGTIPVAFDTGETAGLTATLDKQLAAVRTAPDPVTLMGAEGAAASAWYDWLCKHLPARWRFSGRNRRPPRDPVNALLSLTYTLAMTEARYQLEAAGLDPALGFLHGVVPGRDSLMLDVVEPLRPGVDAFVLGLLEKVVEPRDFHYSQRDGCRLNKAARGTYYQAWAAYRREWPDLEAPTASAGDQEEASAYAGTLSGAAWRVVQSLRRLLPDLAEEPPTDG